MSHLRFFGVWPGSVSAGGSIAELAGSANITKALSFAYNVNADSWGDVAADFAWAREHGQRVLMNLPEGDDRDRFSEWAAVIRPYADQIEAFFLMDEPDCRCNGDRQLLRIFLDGMAEDIARLQRAFPGCRTMFTLGCFNQHVPGLGFAVPDGVTDIAVEAYHGPAQWREWLDRLQPHLQPSHRLWLMPWAYNEANHRYPRTDAEVIYEAQVIYDYAKTDSRVVGLLPFAWYDGARNRPAVREYFSQIGREILRDCVPPAVDRALELHQLAPFEAVSNRAFSLAFLGNGFSPRAVVQYQSPFGWLDYPASRLAENVLVVNVGGVGPGTYTLRVKNPDGSVSGLQTLTCR